MPSSKKADASTDHAADEGQAGIVSADVQSTGFHYRLSKLLLLVAGLIIIIVLALFIKNLIHPPKYKTVNYSNGQGSKFSLTFYHKYYLSKDFTSTKALNLKKIPAGYQNSLTGLASKVSVDNRYPIWFGISTVGLTSALRNTYESNRDIPCTTRTVFTINSTATKQRIPMCIFPLAADRPSYSGTFIYKQKAYFIIVTQVASKKQLADPNSPESAGLDAYQSDITSFVKSLKPL